MVTEAWIPVVVLVRTTMHHDDPDEFYKKNVSEVIEILRSCGDTEAQICGDCADHIEYEACCLDDPEDTMDCLSKELIHFRQYTDDEYANLGK